MKTSTSLKLVLIKIIHTLVWLVFVLIIAFILWSGITNNISGYSMLAVAAVAGEGIVLFLFGGSCPLTVLAKKYSNSNKHNFDIYLPNWLAKYNKVIFGSLFIIGVVCILIRVAVSG